MPYRQEYIPEPESSIWWEYFFDYLRAFSNSDINWIENEIKTLQKTKRCSLIAAYKFNEAWVYACIHANKRAEMLLRDEGLRLLTED